MTGARNVFTWNRTRFPDPRKFVQDFRNRGIRIAANIKPWLLKEHRDYKKILSARGFIWDMEVSMRSMFFSLFNHYSSWILHASLGFGRLEEDLQLLDHILISLILKVENIGKLV